MIMYVFIRTNLYKAALIASAALLMLSVHAGEHQQTPLDLPVIDTALLRSFMADPSTLSLIDARSFDEYDESHIAGAANIPFDNVDESFRELPEDPSAMVIVYCRTGRRATILKEQMEATGYSDVRVLPAQQIIVDADGMALNCGTADEPARCEAS